MEKILEIETLKKYYGKRENETRAIDGLSLQVMSGEFIGIMGSSGSGKTTLLNCIAATMRPTTGTISLRGNNILKYKGRDLAEYRGKQIGYLFQNFELLDNLTGMENIMLPMEIQKEINDKTIREMKKLADYFEIQDVLKKFPSQMSGGQKQRVAAARALVLNPELVLADEPTGALDSKNAKILMNKLTGLNEEKNTTILMVTHDSNAASYCSRILFIQDGKIFHELRKRLPEETRQDFYERILTVMAQLGGGSTNVL